LRSRVDIGEYAKKLKANAEIFAASDNDRVLAGLMCLYANGPKILFKSDFSCRQNYYCERQYYFHNKTRQSGHSRADEKPDVL
jgi:hypothetical protein